MKQIILKYQDFLNEKEFLTDADLSGEYSGIYTFIMDNGLQKEFVAKYKNDEPSLNIDNWDEFMGDFGSDEEIIADMLGNGYRIFYDEYEDIFKVIKKKKGNINYKIIKSEDNDILDVIGVQSFYEPRFAVIFSNNIIGGSTYEVDEDNVYNFDVGISEEYQGVGIFKKLLNMIILDAKELKCSGIKAMVVNNMLFDYLTTNGFSGSRDGDIKYAYKKM